ncbi:MAG: hypothetical protein FVQ80_06965 [Planctomycetes bacterium]|nr:hypothetical protein [Planctomycetota bacterium]
MPKQLEDCIKKVMAQGKTRDEAVPICVASTGLKMKEDEVEKPKHTFIENCVGPGYWKFS